MIGENMTQTPYDVSVIICAYTEDRWDDLLAAVDTVRQQTLPPRELIVVVDHNPSLLERVRAHLSDAIVVENTETPGLRGARNCGIAAAHGRLIAFLDDDAIAIADWLKFLCEGYSDPRVLGTGGPVTPLWAEKQPSWFPEEFYWVVGCTYHGMPLKGAVLRNPIGANMCFRREVFETVGDFHSEIEAAGHAGGCEETELCIRARQHWPEGLFLYCPQANVSHRVSAQRARWRYFRSRCYAEGSAKAILAYYVGAKDSLASERTYTLRTLPMGVMRSVRGGILRLDLPSFQRAGAIIAGLIITTSGYLVGSLARHLTPDKETSKGAGRKFKQSLKAHN
jgi:glycosyltransferase involved in cell wall biosynthesis